MELTQTELKRVLDYNPETGIFTWIVSTARRIKVGDIAASAHNAGYLSARIHTKPYLLHRLAWFYVYGAWPKKHIDHINMDKADNRISNLREANRSQNLCNVKLKSSSTSKLKGACWDKSKNKWVAYITFEKRRKHLGRFDTAEAAHAAYCTAAAEHHGEFARFK